MSEGRNIVWRLGLLGLGFPFHLLLLLAVHDPQGMLGVRGELPLLAWGVLGAHLLLAGTSATLLLRRRPSRAALVGTVASLLGLPLYLVAFPSSWGVGLTGMLFALVQARLLARPFRMAAEDLWPSHGGREPLAGVDWADLLMLASVVMVAALLIVEGYCLVDTRLGVVAAWACVVLGLVVSLVFEVEHYRLSHGRGVPAYALLGFALLAAWWSPLGGFLVPVLAVRQLGVATRVWLDKRGGHELWFYLTQRPGALLACSFVSVIAVGTVLLTLPGATASPAGLAFGDALFTSTSATCVTGLIVVDTGSDLSLLGQLVVLAQIQVGGLGLMTLSTFVALLLGHNIGLREEFAVKTAIGEQGSRRAFRLLKFIVVATVVLELIGAGFLAWRFRQLGYPLAEALYQGLFHSVSAFCNAGFSLFPDSLTGFAHAPAIPLAVSVLFVVGGLGFGVLYMAVTFMRRPRGGSNAHVKMVLWASAVLTVGGAAALWFLEYNNAFAEMGMGESWLHAWFQAVTPRTAGFNTMDLRALTPASHLVIMVLMFIGAAPGSTGGGVKVTTLVVLVLVIRTVLTGREDVTFAGRSVQPSTVRNATALVGLALLTVMGATAFLLIGQTPAPGALIFEAVSAFGTVGLSLGATPDLNAAGKLCIIVLMFIGRVGPLTLLIMMRPSGRSRVRYPQADVMVG